MKNVETRGVRRLIRYGGIDCARLRKSSEHEDEETHGHTYTCVHTHGDITYACNLMRDFT